MDKTVLKVKDINSLRDINYTAYKQFGEIMSIMDDVNSKEDFLIFKTLDIFYGIKRKEARQLMPEQIDTLVNKVLKAISEEAVLQNIIELDGIKYGLIPNFEKIKGGELIDLEELYKEDRMIELFSILYRPIIGDINTKGEYRIEPYDEYDDKFKNIDALTAMGCINFFMRSFQILNHYTHLSTETNLKK